MGFDEIHGSYVLRIKDGIYMLDDISPYEALYSAVFGVKTDTLSYSQKGMCMRMFDELMEKLSYKEQIIIDKLYGYRGVRYSRTQLADQFDISVQEVDELEKNALERMKSPDSYRYLEKRWYSDTDIHNPEYELDYKGKLISEIESYIFGDGEGLSYVPAIFDRNGIEIKKSDGRGAGLYAVNDPIHTDIPGLKDIDDIMSSLNEYSIPARPVDNRRRRKHFRVGAITVTIAHGEKEYTYNYRGLSENDIAKCIFKVLSDEFSISGCLLDFNLSDGLLGILLLKGYLYIDMVVADKGDIIQSINRVGLSVLAEELMDFADKASVYLADTLHLPHTFFIIPPEVALRIYEDVPVDYHELIACVESVDRKLALELIRGTNEEFEDFRDLYITEEVRNRLYASDRSLKMNHDGQKCAEDTA